MSEDISKKKVIFILGGPGSGKGTQCALLKENIPLLHVSSGDVLRAEVASGSELGKKIDADIKEGRLVDQAVVLQLIRKAIEASPHEIVLLDGFPRSASQLEEFEREVCPCHFAVYFNCTEEEMLNRIHARAAAAAAGEKRSDDNDEAAKKRFRVFQNQSIAAIEMLKRVGKLHEINAMREKDQVYHDFSALF